MRNVKPVGFYCKNNVMNPRRSRMPRWLAEADFRPAILIYTQRIIFVFSFDAAARGLLTHQAGGHEKNGVWRVISLF
jgi:hypothetical protein